MADVAEATPEVPADEGEDDGEDENVLPSDDADLDVRRLEAMSDDPFLDGPPSLGDFLSQQQGGGYVVDPAVAREAPCIGFQLAANAPPDAPPDLVFSKGVVGALDKDQVEMFCPTIETRPLSDAQRDRLQAFTDASKTCSVEVAELPRGERLDPYLGCMSTELHRRGQKL